MMGTKKYFIWVFTFSVIVIASESLQAQELFTMPQGTESRVSSFENLSGVKGAGGQSNKGAKGHAFDRVKAGESKVLLDVNSAGIIQRMWFTINDRSPIMLRSLRFQIYWDGATKPAVDVPFGDFFCATQGGPIAFQSSLFASPEGRSFICYIPMPFKKGAKVILTNESKKDLAMLFYDIDFTTLAKPPKDMLYFHSCWNRKKSGTLGDDFEMLPAIKGTGRFIGVNIAVNADSAYGNTWWGEGEVKIYLDGDSTHPTINGTGAEDYAGTGWGLGSFTQLYQGCTIANERSHQYAFYRFHIPDPIYFHKAIKATIQEIGGGNYEEVRTLAAKGISLIPVTVDGPNHFTRLKETPLSLTDPAFPKGWVNFYRIDDYAATAYFYLDKPVNNLAELSPVGDRIK